MPVTNVINHQAFSLIVGTIVTPSTTFPANKTSGTLDVTLSAPDFADVNFRFKVTIQKSADNGVTWVDDLALEWNGPPTGPAPGGGTGQPSMIFSLQGLSGKVRASITSNKATTVTVDFKAS